MVSLRGRFPGRSVHDLNSGPAWHRPGHAFNWREQQEMQTRQRGGARRPDEGYLDTANAPSLRENSMATPFLVCSILLTVPSPLRISVSGCPVISGGRYK
jgi:hypothetical protein